MKNNLKLLTLLKIMIDETDENNILTMGQIIKKLKLYGISAERKSIYRDIQALKEFGYEISLYEENKKGYYMESSTLDLYEIKLLVDAVLSARFITEKKTNELIEKLLTLTSKHNGSKIKKTCCCGVNKSSNELVFYNLDAVNRAIIENKKVSFEYFYFDEKINEISSKYGLRYIVNPYALAWKEDNCYLIGNYESYSDPSHYRIDRMKMVEVSNENRKPVEKVKGFENGISEYVNKLFHMHTGEEDRIELHFTKGMVNAIIDRFGTHINISEVNKDWYKISTKAIVSYGLIFWIMQFGDQIELVKPKTLRAEIKARAQKIADLY